MHRGLKQRLAQRVRSWFRREPAVAAPLVAAGDRPSLVDGLGRYSVVAGYCKRLKRGGAILDLGCGEGMLHELLDPACYSRYVGVDNAERAIRRACERQNRASSFVLEDLRYFVPVGRFDVIVFNRSLRSAPHPLRTLARYQRYLADKGFFLLSMELERNAPLWREIESAYTVLDAVTIRAAGRSWHCKLLAPVNRVAPDTLARNARRNGHPANKQPGWF